MNIIRETKKPVWWIVILLIVIVVLFTIIPNMVQAEDATAPNPFPVTTTDFATLLLIGSEDDKDDLLKAARFLEESADCLTNIARAFSSNTASGSTIPWSPEQLIELDQQNIACAAQVDTAYDLILDSMGLTNGNIQSFIAADNGNRVKSAPVRCKDDETVCRGYVAPTPIPPTATPIPPTEVPQ